MSEHTHPEELTDSELYTEFQHVKEHGPNLRLDELMREICERWEAEHRDAD